MAATHRGHCQVCGSLQKLPKGKLSLHGYTVAYGFFSGICTGARELPFELSCDLVKGAVARAKVALKSTQEEQAALRTLPVEPIAWVHHYVGFQGRGRSSHRWMQVILASEFVPFREAKSPTDGYHKTHYTAAGKDGQPKRHDLQSYDSTADPREAALKLNSRRAEWLEHQVDSLKRYITWQQARVTNWKPEPLLPVNAPSDKKLDAGFKPTEPKY